MAAWTAHRPGSFEHGGYGRRVTAQSPYMASVQQALQRQVADVVEQLRQYAVQNGIQATTAELYAAAGRIIAEREQGASKE